MSYVCALCVRLFVTECGRSIYCKIFYLDALGTRINGLEDSEFCNYMRFTSQFRSLLYLPSDVLLKYVIRFAFRIINS